MATKEQRSLDLFGGAKKWNADEWCASDDRVRGGKSQSYLDCFDQFATFRGTLDIKTLGGAGFASQRTTAEDKVWNLDDYVAIKLAVKKGDKKRYTLILKDELLERNPENGREQSTISYECDFELPPEDVPGETGDRTIVIPFKSLTATYRGKPKPDAQPLDLTKVKRFSLMNRSFFGSQSGDFSLSISAISAIDVIPKASDVVVSRKGERQLEDGLTARVISTNQYLH
ncbi:hypothetical protein BAUCODRAFT_20966 [Baudoinia panamericana UAMH 10762]|uniref:NADH:ubiquinone oxidoreductase intermediate-associated protein 30 domain-containing protein n=1 Tax=Baudoinia panamericana (strain UAMH 10762) TaxID=717646 RepID=M2MVK6_BAUPA|nr:uncharacterized protein BAUCODRAFT_20966 [Baudoinia panamericana UAMH 10762]EMD00992.1 hypothetical protein BAUCODRAFT_20966 [Baudoinia panamericana UAMH 10762]